jgi:hypothetical protein
LTAWSGGHPVLGIFWALAQADRAQAAIKKRAERMKFGGIADKVQFEN